MEFLLIYLPISAFVLWVVIQSAVKSGIENAETSKMIKRYIEYVSKNKRK